MSDGLAFGPKTSWRRSLEAAGWGALTLTYLAWWSRLAGGDYPHSLLAHGDLSYPGALVEDLIRLGGRFADWFPPPAPYYFPEMALFAVVRPAVANFETAQAMTGMLQCLLIVIAARLAIGAALPKTDWAPPSVPSFFAAAIALSLTNRLPVVEQILLTGIHAGALFGLFACAGLLMAHRHRAASIATLCGLSFLAGASDGLFLVGWAVPAALVGLVGAAVHRLTRTNRTPLVPALPALAGLVFAIAGSQAHRKLSPHPAPGHMQLRLGELGGTIRQAMVDFAGFDWTLSLWVAGGIGAGIVLGASGLRKRSTDSMVQRAQLAALFCASSLCTLSAIITTGNLSGGGWVRYLLSPAVLGALSLWLLALSITSRRVERWLTLAGVVASFILVLAVGATSRWRVGPILPSKESEQAQCVDRIAQDENVASAVSDYWHSKPLTVLSQRGVRVMAFSSELNLYQWITSNGWFRRDAGFVVADGLDRTVLDQKLGAPQTTVSCGGLTFLIYRGEARDRLRSIVDRELQP